MEIDTLEYPRVKATAVSVRLWIYLCAFKNTNKDQVLGGYMAPVLSSKCLEFLHIVSGENGTDIFRLYSRPNPFRGVQICPYPGLDIQHPISYPYPNNQIAYL